MRASLVLLVIILSLTACTPGGGKAAPSPPKAAVPEPKKQAAIPQPVQDPVIGTALRELFPHDPATNVFAEVTPRDSKMPAAGFLLDFDGGVERVTAVLQAPLDPSLVVMVLPDLGFGVEGVTNTWAGVADQNAALVVMPLPSSIGRNPGRWTVEEREALYVESVADVRRLLNGFEQVAQLKGIPVILVGEGRGAEVALMATAADSRIDGLVMQSMLGGPGTDGNRALLYADPPLPPAFQPVNLAPFLSARPVLMQNPREDPAVVVEGLTAIYEQCGPHKTQRWYDGATLPTAAVADALEWLRATFPPPVTAQDS